MRAALPGSPHGLPSGKSVCTTRATPTCSTISRAAARMTVGMPLASRWRLTRLMVWWQTGQTGTRMATSAPSSLQRSSTSGASRSRATALAVGVEHAMEPLRHPADAPGLRGRMQMRGGEEGVHVLQGGGGLVETARRAVELAGRQAGRDGVRAADDAHAGFVLGVRVSDDGDLAGRNQRDTAFGQRFAQRSERHVVVLRPLIWFLVSLGQVVIAGLVDIANGRSHAWLLAVSNHVHDCRRTVSRRRPASVRIPNPCRRQDFSMRKIDAYPLPAVADAQSMPDTDFDRMQAAGGAQCGADRHRTTRPLAI